MPATPPPDLRFRIAAKSDCDVILRALQELAASLGVPERLRSTRAGLERHGFGERPEFEVMLAEDDGGFAGMCLYFPSSRPGWASPASTCRIFM